MPFHMVLDLALVLLVEVYREYGMKYHEIMDELNKQIAEPVARLQRRQPETDNEASMSLLMGMMSGSDFRGARS